MIRLDSTGLSLLASTILFLAASCAPAELPVEQTPCSAAEEAESAAHPDDALYQGILEDHRRRGLAGATVYLRDADGIWMGADGYASLEHAQELEACDQFLIASISKMFTGSAIMRMIDRGLVGLDDPLGGVLSASQLDDVANASVATLRQILAHESGIADYYTLAFELQRVDLEYTGNTQEDVLDFVRGEDATDPVGATYYYSNTNYLLLGMALEELTGLPLAEVYETEIFEPRGLATAWYGTGGVVPPTAVHGYADAFGNGELLYTDFMYRDELSTGDGGIAINARDLGLFLEALFEDDLVSPTSLMEMTDFTDLPEYWVDDVLGHTKNGLAVEYFDTGVAIGYGHTGGVDGFNTIAMYFPDRGYSLVVLVNTVGLPEPITADLFLELLGAMYEP